MNKLRKGYAHYAFEISVPYVGIIRIRLMGIISTGLPPTLSSQCGVPVPQAIVVFLINRWRSYDYYLTSTSFISYNLHQFLPVR